MILCQAELEFLEVSGTELALRGAILTWIGQKWQEGDTGRDLQHGKCSRSIAMQTLKSGSLINNRAAMVLVVSVPGG